MEPQYLTSLQWGLILALCWKSKKFKDAFEVDPRHAISAFRSEFPPDSFPEDMSEFRVLAIPPNPGDVPDVEAIADGTQTAVALPYSCGC